MRAERSSQKTKPALSAECNDRGFLERDIVQISDLLLGRVTELHAQEAARAKVEARYLDGAAADFPAARRAWAEQRGRSETMAVIAMRIAELDGAEPAPPDDHVAIDARVTTFVSDLVEPARSKAYDELGDGRRALAIAVGWLRPKLIADPALSGSQASSTTIT